MLKTVRYPVGKSATTFIKEFLGDIFELLLFVDPQKCVTHTKDKSIVIINNEHPANRKGIDWSNKLIIPDSYVSKF